MKLMMNTMMRPQAAAPMIELSSRAPGKSEAVMRRATRAMVSAKTPKMMSKIRFTL